MYLRARFSSQLCALTENQREGAGEGEGEDAQGDADRDPEGAVVERRAVPVVARRGGDGDARPPEGEAHVVVAVRAREGRARGGRGRGGGVGGAREEVLDVVVEGVLELGDVGRVDLGSRSAVKSGRCVLRRGGGESGCGEEVSDVEREARAGGTHRVALE